MVALNKAFSELGAPFSNEAQIVRVVYDFAVDGGALGDFDVLVADDVIAVKLMHAYVQTAVTSAGSLDLDLGKGAGGVEFLSSTAVASLTLGAILNPASQNFVKLAEGEKIVMGIDTAAATAGKIEFTFLVSKL